MIVLTIISLLVIEFVTDEFLDSSPVSYTPNESVDNLINSMEDSFLKQKNNSTVISCVFLAVMLVVSSIIGESGIDFCFSMQHPAFLSAE